MGCSTRTFPGGVMVVRWSRTPQAAPFGLRRPRIGGGQAMTGYNDRYSTCRVRPARIRNRPVSANCGRVGSPGFSRGKSFCLLACKLPYPNGRRSGMGKQPLTITGRNDGTFFYQFSNGSTQYPQFLDPHGISEETLSRSRLRRDTCSFSCGENAGPSLARDRRHTQADQ